MAFVLAAVTVISLSQRGAELERARRSWGTTVTVLTATEDISPGEPLAGKVTSTEMPEGLAPERPWTQPTGVARQRVDTGAVLTQVDVADGEGPLALVPTGWVAVPVNETLKSGAQVGDHVEVISAGMMIADEALVVDTADEVLLLAVPSEDAGVVSAASDTDALTLVRVRVGDESGGTD